MFLQVQNIGVIYLFVRLAEKIQSEKIYKKPN